MLRVSIMSILCFSTCAHVNMFAWYLMQGIESITYIFLNNNKQVRLNLIDKTSLIINQNIN